MQFDLELLQECWFLAGPTAVGKTATAIELAEKLNAEILSMDSMAIYRHMDIGTAKPDEVEQRRIPHHLIDLIEPSEEFSLADFVVAAERVTREVTARGQAVLFAGGTGLYLRGLLRGVFDGPSADWEFRKKLESQAEGKPEDFLHRQLEAVDPISAGRLHPRDHRRIIRAIEVHYLTGQPLSAMQQHGPLSEDVRPRNVFWLHPPRTWLHERINQRVDHMLEQGLIEEVKTLLELQPPISRTARQGLGYKEVIEHLNGETDEAEMRGIIQKRTRQFAKRQHTWFRNLEECQAIDVTGEETPPQIAERISTQSGH